MCVAVAHPGYVDTGSSYIWKQQPIDASAGMPQAKQLAVRGYNPTNQRTSCLKAKEPTAASGHAPRHGPAHQRARTQLCPPVGRHWPLPPGSLHKPLDQPHPPGGRHQKQENYIPPPLHPARRPDPTPTLGPAGLWPCPLAG